MAFDSVFEPFIFGDIVSSSYSFLEINGYFAKFGRALHLKSFFSISLEAFLLLSGGSAKLQKRRPRINTM